MTARKVFLQLNNSNMKSAWDLLKTTNRFDLKNKSKGSTSYANVNKIINFIRSRSPIGYITPYKLLKSNTDFVKNDVLSKAPLSRNYRIKCDHNKTILNMKVNPSLITKNLERADIDDKNRNKSLPRMNGKFQDALEKCMYKLEYERKITKHSIRWLRSNRIYNIKNNSSELSKIIPGIDKGIDSISKMYANNNSEFHITKGITYYKLGNLARPDNKSLRSAMEVYPNIFHKLETPLPIRKIKQL